ncbi:MAG: SDR family NAD(P)-dependent oxidoreductase [Deltaproteobacteria bacterium]|nr:SDR family NAD(P)-dependent oxidoreductase [Deltaproteobacteria bacterium]
MEKMLKDRVAIITGSGRGIGRAAALLFAQEGAKVVVSDIDAQPAEEVAKAIKAFGGECLAVPGDVTAPSFAETIVGQAVQTWGGLHIFRTMYPPSALKSPEDSDRSFSPEPQRIKKICRGPLIEDLSGNCSGGFFLVL